MENKHTRGPWAVKTMYYRGHGSSETYFIYDADGNMLHSPGGDAGTMKSPEPYEGFGFKQEDARLIAAAPDLLDALEELVRICQSDLELQFGEKLGKKIRTSLAKARA
jgi:hypothetical protein